MFNQRSLCSILSTEISVLQVRAKRQGRQVKKNAQMAKSTDIANAMFLILHLNSSESIKQTQAEMSQGGKQEWRERRMATH